jgi:hypothetical protein
LEAPLQYIPSNKLAPLFVFFNTGEERFEKIRKFYFFYLKKNTCNGILVETIVMIVAFCRIVSQIPPLTVRQGVRISSLV